MASKTEITDFTDNIEKLVLRRDMSYIDAIVFYCEKNNIEIEVASKLITKPILDRIEREADGLNLLVKKTHRLTEFFS